MMIFCSIGVSALGLEFTDIDEYNAFVDKWTASTKSYGLKVTGVSHCAQNPTCTVSFEVSISGTYFDTELNESVTEEFDRIPYSISVDKSLTLNQMKLELRDTAKMLIKDWKLGTQQNKPTCSELVGFEAVVSE